MGALPVVIEEPAVEVRGGVEIVVDRVVHAEAAFFLARAFLVRAAAAAFEAFKAISRRCSAVIVWRRAFPPFRPISARYLDTCEASMRGRYHLSGLEARERFYLTIPPKRLRVEMKSGRPGVTSTEPALTR